MEFKYTIHQVPRTSMADAIVNNKFYLIKNCLELKATYQIKMLLFIAQNKKSKLILKIKKECVLSAELKELAKNNKLSFKIEKF